MVRLLALALVVFASGCGPAAESEPLAVELRLYPTGVESSPRYTVAVVSDSVIATTHRSPLTVDRLVARRALSASERDSLRHLAAAAAGVRATDSTVHVDDAWGATLTIGGDAAYRDSDFSFDSPPPEVRSLVRYLRKLSGLSIELYSFS